VVESALFAANRVLVRSERVGNLRRELARSRRAVAQLVEFVLEAHEVVDRLRVLRKIDGRLAREPVSRDAQDRARLEALA